MKFFLSYCANLCGNVSLIKFIEQIFQVQFNWSVYAMYRMNKYGKAGVSTDYSY